MSIKSPVVVQYDSSGAEVVPATETKLEAVRALLTALDAKDFSTEATLDAFLTAFNNEDFASQATLDALLTAFNNEDFATQTTLNSLLTAFNAEDFATQATLATRASEATVATLLTNTQLRASAVPVSAASLPLPAGAATQATLATRASEATLATRLTEVTGAAIQTILTAIRDTAGIKKITDALPTGANLLGRVKLESGDGSGYVANVDASKRLLVSLVPVAPSGTTSISRLAQGSVGSSSNTDYTVPNGKTLTITQFFAGGEIDGKESKFELYHSTDGGSTNGTLLAFAYIGEGAQNFQVNLNYSVLGSGTSQVIRMRRVRLDAVARELAISWEGNVTI